MSGQAPTDRPKVGEVWLSRYVAGLYVAVLEVREEKVRFAPVQVSPDGLVTRDVRCSQPRIDSHEGLRRAFARTRLRLELVPRSPQREAR